jgi:hypothetical protein
MSGAEYRQPPRIRARQCVDRQRIAGGSAKSICLTRLDDCCDPACARI